MEEIEEEFNKALFEIGIRDLFSTENFARKIIQHFEKKGKLNEFKEYVNRIKKRPDYQLLEFIDKLNGKEVKLPFYEILENEGITLDLGNFLRLNGERVAYVGEKIIPLKGKKAKLREALRRIIELRKELSYPEEVYELPSYADEENGWFDLENLKRIYPEDFVEANNSAYDFGQFWKNIDKPIRESEDPFVQALIHLDELPEYDPEEELRRQKFEKEFRKVEIKLEILNEIPRIKINERKILGIIPRVNLELNPGYEEFFYNHLGKYSTHEIYSAFKELEKELSGENKFKLKALRKKFEKREGISKRRKYALLMAGILGASAALAAFRFYLKPKEEVEKPSIKFFFDKNKNVLFDYIEFLDKNGKVIQHLDFNETISQYLGNGFKNVRSVTWLGENVWVGEAYGNCTLKIIPPEDAHFLKIRAAYEPLNYTMEWKELLKNIIRMGVEFNGTITDDGMHVNGTDLTKCISERFWVSYYVLKPEDDSDRDGIPNCIKIGEKHYRALDINPRIPDPRPVKTDVNIGVYYIWGWGNKTTVWKWENGGSEYLPLLGFYDSRDPDVIDWHIKWSVEHGINVFLLPSTLGAPFEFEKEDGLMRARFLPYIKFAMVQMPYLEKDFTTLQAAENAMSYYCNNYFNHPQYFKVNEKPFVMLWRMQDTFLGKLDIGNFTSFLEKVRETARNHGYELFLVGDVMGYYPQEVHEIGVKPFDAISAYAIINAGAKWTYDEKGQPYLIAPYDSMITGYIEQTRYWSQLAKKLSKNFIPSAIAGFSNEKRYNLGYDNWLCKRTDYSPEKFRLMIKGIKPYIDPQLNMIIVHAFNENQEGSMLEPSKEFGFENLKILYEEFKNRK